MLEVLRLADMMGFDFAREWAEVWLANSSIMDLWNSCVLLEHAHNCGAAQLVELAVYTIINMYEFVQKTDEWRDLDEEVKALVYSSRDTGDSS